MFESLAFGPVVDAFAASVCLQSSAHIQRNAWTCKYRLTILANRVRTSEQGSSWSTEKDGRMRSEQRFSFAKVAVNGFNRPPCDRLSDQFIQFVYEKEKFMKRQGSMIMLAFTLAICSIAEVLFVAAPASAGGDSGGCAGGAVPPNCSAGTCNGSKTCTNPVEDKKPCHCV